MEKSRWPFEQCRWPLPSLHMLSAPQTSCGLCALRRLLSTHFTFCKIVRLKNSHNFCETSFVYSKSVRSILLVIRVPIAGGSYYAIFSISLPPHIPFAYRSLTAYNCRHTVIFPNEPQPNTKTHRFNENGTLQTISFSHDSLQLPLNGKTA